MAQPTQSTNASLSKKRKDPPNASSTTKPSPKKKQKTDHRARQRDARTLSTQTTSKAFQHGAIDVSAFVKAREYEIRALESGIQRSGKANNRRAFQQVPKDLRRRTASHNAKRIPKRLRKRAEKEMIEDNTPTVNARTRKPTRHMRLRMDTVKRLRALGAQGKGGKTKQAAERVTGAETQPPAEPSGNDTTHLVQDHAQSVQPRKPRVKRKPTLSTPPTPKSRFRKRQVHKSWLPTHLFHAKRAHMTPPSAPLWRFAVPLSPTQKDYRPTHRAFAERGAVAWDISYMATIGLEGREASIGTVLKGLGVEPSSDGEKWKNGTRVHEVWAHERESKDLIAPITIIWCVSPSSATSQSRRDGADKCKAFLRVHPSAFLQLWEEVTRLAQVAKPSVAVEDLRFEIGSIEVTGPGSTEALLSALWPTNKQAEESVGKSWMSLAGITSPSTLPSGALLGFDVQDPRLHHPPQTIKLPRSQEEYEKLLQLVADWPIDRVQQAPSIFDRAARQRGSKLASQRAINRRRSLAKSGEYPMTNPTDPEIPILLHNSPFSAPPAPKLSRSSWTLLAPWKAIQPIWYSIQCYPLSTGQQPRFGGLDQQRQLAFEAGLPWFPADYPGTKAGWEWEVSERNERLAQWEMRPKGKRVSWQKVNLGGGGKIGEIGLGWACDWSLLLALTRTSGVGGGAGEARESGKEQTERAGETAAVAKPGPLMQLPSAQALAVLKGPPNDSVDDLVGKLVTVRITLLARGVPEACARIYRLPSASVDPKRRSAWLALRPESRRKNKQRGNSRRGLPRVPNDDPPHILQRRLAQSLLLPPRAGEDHYATCPEEEDLIGFATTGTFSLAEGRGSGIGCLMIQRVLEDVQAPADEAQLCVVRNAGESVGRLGKWEVV